MDFFNQVYKPIFGEGFRILRANKNSQAFFENFYDQ